MDAAMEGLLPQRRHTQRRHHSNPRSGRPDPPTGTTPHGNRQRRKKKGHNDGYENSGHETSDFMFTEDDKSDFYLFTEDERHDDKGIDIDDKEEDIMGPILDAAKKLSLGSDDDTTGMPSGDKGEPPKNNQDKRDEKKSVPSDDKPGESEPPAQSQQATTPSPKPKKKPRQRRRTPKTKKAPQAVPETPPVSMQEEEELDCHTPMKTALQQAQQQQTPKRQTQQQKTQRGKKHQQPAIPEKEFVDPHEDEDDYPADIMSTPVKEEGNGGKQNTNAFIEDELTFLKMHQQPKRRSMEEELSYLKRISSTRYQVQIGMFCLMQRNIQ